MFKIILIIFSLLPLIPAKSKPKKKTTIEKITDDILKLIVVGEQSNKELVLEINKTSREIAKGNIRELGKFIRLHSTEDTFKSNNPGSFNMISVPFEIGQCTAIQELKKSISE